MPTLIIRDMQENDLPTVLEIEQASFTTPWSNQDFLIEIYKKNVLSKVAVLEENIIGHILVNYYLHESNILTLAVHPDFRRRGIATILLEEVITELKKRGCVFMYLKVRFSNTVAQRFYELLGFKIEGIRKKYYESPVEDAIIMMYRL